MKILIAEKIILSGYATPKQYKDAMEEIAGQWIDVETDHLFENQYNVTTPNGVGLRIMESQVRGVQDDARTGKQRCNYCGKISEYIGLDLCPHCGYYGYVKKFENVEERHIVQVNKNWKLKYTTKCRSITPYGYAEITIINVKTNETFKAQRWEQWSSCHIEKDVPQVVKNELRKIFNKYRLSFRNWITNTRYVERNY